MKEKKKSKTPPAMPRPKNLDTEFLIQEMHKWKISHNGTHFVNRFNEHISIWGLCALLSAPANQRLCKDIETWLTGLNVYQQKGTK